MASTAYTLVVGSKQVSSWSLRPWILMKQAGIAFDEVVIRLRQIGTSARRSWTTRRPAWCRCLSTAP